MLVVCVAVLGVRYSRFAPKPQICLQFVHLLFVHSQWHPLCHPTGFLHLERRVVAGNQFLIRERAGTKPKQFASKGNDMRVKIMILVALCMSALSAVAADWRFIEENGSRVRYYIDDSTITPDKSMRRVWMLLDNKTLDAYGNLSTRIFADFDCAQKRHRLLQIEGFKKNMASGVMASSDVGSNEWRYISPGTVINEVLIEVCTPSKSKGKSKKKPLNDCDEEAVFIRVNLILRNQGMPIEDALVAAEYGERDAARPNELEERLNRRRSIVKYAYTKNPASSDESVRLWFDSCTKGNNG